MKQKFEHFEEKEATTVNMKNRWNRISAKLKPAETLNELTSQDVGNAKLDVSYCEQLLCKPSSQNYAALNKWLEKCPREWMEEFLDCNALQYMFATLDIMGSKQNGSFSDAVIQLQIISSIKTVLNSKVGMDYLIDDDTQLVQQMMNGKHKATMLVSIAKLAYLFFKMRSIFENGISSGLSCHSCICVLLLTQHFCDVSYAIKH